jgi:hypothetical protein
VLPVEAGITLADLIARLGPYDSSRGSKTSTARFQTTTPGGPVRVIASLLSHQVRPEAPVTALSTYRVEDSRP